MTILPLLALSGACAPQLAIVRGEWPDGIPLTDEAAARAVELGVDVAWAAGHLLTAAELAEYQRVIALAEAEYQRVIALAEAEYQRVIALALVRTLRAREVTR